MTKNLYRIDKRPETAAFFVQRFAVIRIRFKRYTVAVRDVPNERAMEYEFQVDLDSPLYHETPERAARAYVEALEREIREHERLAAAAKNTLARARDDLAGALETVSDETNELMGRLDLEGEND